MQKPSHKCNALFKGVAIAPVAILSGMKSGRLQDGLGRVYSSKKNDSYYNPNWLTQAELKSNSFFLTIVLSGGQWAPIKNRNFSIPITTLKVWSSYQCCPIVKDHNHIKHWHVYCLFNLRRVGGAAKSNQKIVAGWHIMLPLQCIERHGMSKI